MKFVWSPDYEIDIGAHVFPTSKYRLIRDLLLEQDVCAVEDFLIPVPATRNQLEMVHSAEFIDDLINLRQTNRTLHSELPLDREIVDGYVLAAGGTILACRAAFGVTPSIACHIGGGFHHAFADHAEGFCYINDIAVGIRVMQEEGRIQRAMVIDCDLHQGNGTARIFQDDPEVFTFSIHQENNYPLKQMSDVDIGLKDFTGDAEYLSQLQNVLPAILDSHKPELIIYVAGADPYKNDVLGGLNLTIEGLAKRDHLVLHEAVTRHIPIVTVTAGGYAQQLSDTVKIQGQTCEIAASLFLKYSN